MIRRLLLALLLALPGCASSPGPEVLSRETGASFLVGKWSGTRDCSDIVEYRADGTYRAGQGFTGRWSLVGDRLTMRAQSEATVSVRVISRNEIEIRLVGSAAAAAPTRSFRCRGTGRLAR
jgi:hypothetical protein